AIRAIEESLPDSSDPPAPPPPAPMPPIPLPAANRDLTFSPRPVANLAGSCAATLNRPLLANPPVPLLFAIEAAAFLMALTGLAIISAAILAPSQIFLPKFLTPFHALPNGFDQNP